MEDKSKVDHLILDLCNKAESFLQKYMDVKNSNIFLFFW